MALLSGNLLPASFRGAPFAVSADDLGGGRRIALHQYPGRDDPWAEDMGRAARQFRFRGFICDGDLVFLGGPILLQRALLLAALEKSGSGLLIHPTLGPIQVSVTRFSVSADLGAGRTASVDVEFVESGKQLFPSILSSSSGLLSAANLVKVALAADAVRVIAALAASGARQRDLTATAAAWSSRAVALGADATALHRLAAQLPGDYGRFAEGGNAGFTGRRSSAVPVDASINDLIVITSAARVSITTSAQALGVVVGATNLVAPGALPVAIDALIAALVTACADPADAIRLLELLASYVSSRPEAETAIGTAFSRMVQRAVAAALVIAGGEYQPTSSDDAAAMIVRIAGLIEQMASAAADSGDDLSFKALRAARVAAVQDLRSRGATLARVKTFVPGSPLPSVRLAQRYYRDATRAEQLEAQVPAPHPLFMPSRFLALAA